MMHGARIPRVNRAVSVALAGLLLLVHPLAGQPPINNYTDPNMIHSVRGANQFYPQYDEPRFSISLVPFYAHAAGAKPLKGQTNQCCFPNPGNPTPGTADCCTLSCIPSCKGKKVPEGDRLGRWNMIGLFQGQQGACGGRITQECQPTMFCVLQELEATDFFNPKDCTQPYVDPLQLFGFFSVPINYQKIGLRSMARLYLAGGFGMTARGGFARYKQIACFNDKTCDAEGVLLCTPCNSSAEPGCSDITLVQQQIMAQNQASKIFCNIGLDINPVNHSGFEDTHLQLDWSGAYEFCNDLHELIVTVQPYAAMGVWFPTGGTQHANKAFSLPFGNNGFWAGTFEGGLNFAFPNSIILGAGAAVAVSKRGTQDCWRVPTSCTQSGVYPWTTSISRRPGVTWNAHFDIAALDFIEGLSFFFNFEYAKHEQDKIDINCDNSCVQTPYGLLGPKFLPKQLEKDSLWDSQVVFFGLDYRITDHLSMGLAVQLPVTGTQIYKVSTILGSLQFYF